MSKLSLANFKSDYNRMVIRYRNEEERMLQVDLHITRYFSHIEKECREWLKNSSNLQVV